MTILPKPSSGPNWAALASIFGGALGAAGSPGGFRNFSAGAAQGAQNYQSLQDAQIRRQLQEQQLKLAQEEADYRRTENQRKADAEAQWKASIPNLFQHDAGMAAGGQGPSSIIPSASGPFGNLPPERQAMLQQALQYATPEQGAGILLDFATKEPDGGKWQITDALEGNQKVTYRINLNTGERQEIGRGPAYAPQQDGGPKTSLVPFYTTDPQGNVHMFQPTATGVPVEVQLPPGMSPTKPLSFQDLGTSVVGVQPLGGQPTVSLPKDVSGAAEQKTIGEATGKAKVDLPGVEANADYIKQTIQGLIDAPGREAATGTSGFFNPLLAYDGSERKDFLVRRDQLKGQAFLNAYDSLKGGGQITEVEGAKAEAAKARLDTAQSDAEFLAALKEFQEQVDKLVDIARKKAAGAPSVGGTDYKSKYGLD